MLSTSCFAVYPLTCYLVLSRFKYVFPLIKVHILYQPSIQIWSSQALSINLTTIRVLQLMYVRLFSMRSSSCEAVFVWGLIPVTSSSCGVFLQDCSKGSSDQYKELKFIKFLKYSSDWRDNFIIEKETLLSPRYLTCYLCKFNNGYLQHFISKYYILLNAHIWQESPRTWSPLETAGDFPQVYSST